MSDGMAIIYRIGSDPAWLELSPDRPSADMTIRELLTKDWDALPLFRWIGQPMGSATGIIGWYMLYNPDAVVDSEPNETAVELYQWARGTTARPKVLYGTIVLARVGKPWDNPKGSPDLEYVDITAGLTYSSAKSLSSDHRYWPKEA